MIILKPIEFRFAYGTTGSQIFPKFAVLIGLWASCTVISSVSTEDEVRWLEDRVPIHGLGYSGAKE